ncbi:condensation domain-containing protein [Gloeothece verrucosa]|uniref:Condensation domain protein n=1 Tax=Gloeothece verrucosa (strain PCC 7822) TaxID=497965 RepID=E0ULB1_GLOV7|nr:condensation domain-containing protein [Gloeothece verrucosa]ADN17741.1 condensation domain protein [Gloeothece verrucosa PCC 7822]
MKYTGNEIDKLSQTEKNFLLREMLEKKQSALFPLSLGQERVWFHAQLNPDSPVYNLAVTYNLKGPLNLIALEQSLQAIINRHQILRTIFLYNGQKPFQSILSNFSYTLSVIDLQNLPEDLRKKQAQNLLIEAARKPFNLTMSLLWSIQLIRCAEEEHILLLIMHHIISDGWSFYVLAEELNQLYKAFCEEKTSPLPDLPIQYVDFAQKQRDWLGCETSSALSSQQSEKQMAYWQKHLQGTISTLKLPVNRFQTNRFTRDLANYQSFQLSPSLTQALKALSKEQNVTLFMTLMASLQVLLHKYSGQEDIIICSPIAGRHRSQLKGLIGYFNNIIPLRTDLSGDPNFLELISRVRLVALNAYKNQDIPFQNIINLPNLIQTSLTKVLLTVDFKWFPDLGLDKIHSESQFIHPGRVNFDIYLSIWEESEQLQGMLEYKTDLFDDSRISQILTDYQNLLEFLVNNPQKRLSSVPSYSQFVETLSVNSIAEIVQTEYEPPRSVLELQVTQIWQEVLGINPIGVHDNLLALGASSLSAARICERIQQTFNSQLSLAKIFQAPTVAQITKLLFSSDSSLATSSLAPIQPHGNKPPLFLCEGVGIYASLIPYLGLEQPIYGLMREISVHDSKTVEEIAERYLKEIYTVQPQGPYYLGGLSFGGLVAFEIAQQLYAKGEQVALLVLFDTPGPGAYIPKPIHLRILGHANNLFKYSLPYLKNKTQKIIQKSQSNVFKNSTFSSAIAMNQLFRKNVYTISRKYKHKVYPGSITLFSLSERSALSDSLFDPALGYIDPFLGWGSIATEGVKMYQFAAEHLTLLKEPYVQLVGKQLKACLQEAHENKPLTELTAFREKKSEKLFR